MNSDSGLIILGAGILGLLLGILLGGLGQFYGGNWLFIIQGALWIIIFVMIRHKERKK